MKNLESCSLYMHTKLKGHDKIVAKLRYHRYIKFGNLYYNKSGPLQS